MPKFQDLPVGGGKWPASSRKRSHKILVISTEVRYSQLMRTTSTGKSATTKPAAKAHKATAPKTMNRATKGKKSAC